MSLLDKRCGRFYVIASVVVLSLSAGCQHQQKADRRVAQRLENIRGVAEYVAKDGSRRSAKLAEMGRRIDREARRDAAKLARDVREVNRLAALDVRRWNERQPVYRKSIAREFWGKPQNIEPVFIDMFY